MRPYMNLITIGCDQDRESSLRRAITALNRSGDVFVAWSNIAVCTLEDPEMARAVEPLLASAHAVICYELDHSQVGAPLVQMLAQWPETPVLPVCSRDKAILLSARLGHFRADGDPSNSLISFAARVAASVGRPTAPKPAAVIRALPDIAHALPPATGDLRLLGEVVAGLRSPSSADVELALRTLAWRTWPGRIPTPVWPRAQSYACTSAV